MNYRQKTILLVCFFIFIVSVLYGPEEINLLIGGAETSFIPRTKFQGFVFIANLENEVAFKMLVAEWFAIFIVFVTGFFLFKSNENIK
jgi:hypothetical protein